MTAITSTGLGSGLDINSIVTAIVDAEKDPALASMISASAAATAAISAYGVLNSELSEFKDSYSDLSRSSTFSAATSSSSDSGILNATLGLGAATGSWSFEVEQQAKAQTLVSPANNQYTDSSAEVGTGTISFSYGTYSEVDGSFSLDADQPVETLTIDASNNSLGELRDAINEGDYSVSASIIDDGDEYRLVLTNKETGAENAMQLTVLDDDGDNADSSGLSSLTYTDTIQHMGETSTAQDAKIIMNGIEISRSTNEIASVIEGVTLNVGGETETGKTVSLTITQDTSNVEEQINAFVENYNSTITQMNSLTAYGGESGSDGALNGDSTVRNIQNQMRAVLNTSVSHGGAVQSFADLGMLTNLDGTLSLNEDTLASVMDSDMDSIADFFTATGSATDSLINFGSKNSTTVPGTYDVEVTKLATQGQLTGTAYTIPMTIDSSNDTFKMRLDGFLSEDIVLTSGTYSSMEDLMTEMQSKINSDVNFVQNDLNVSILDSAGFLSITSNSYGSSSTVAITEIEDASFTSALGLSVAGGINGEDVEGLINGLVAAGSGQNLLSESGDSSGIQIEVTGGSLGDRGTVTYSQGISSMLDDMLDGVIDTNISSSEGDTGTSGTTIDGKIDSLYKKIADLDVQGENLTYKMDKLETRLYKQFNAMDIAVSGLNNLMSYLEATLDSLPGYSNE